MSHALEPALLIGDGEGDGQASHSPRDRDMSPGHRVREGGRRTEHRREAEEDGCRRSTP
jgi:hypothetical protein